MDQISLVHMAKISFLSCHSMSDLRLSRCQSRPKIRRGRTKMPRESPNRGDELTRLLLWYTNVALLQTKESEQEFEFFTMAKVV